MLYVMMTLDNGEQQKRCQLYGLLATKTYGNKLYNKLGLGKAEMQAEIEEFALRYSSQKLADVTHNFYYKLKLKPLCYQIPKETWHIYMPYYEPSTILTTQKNLKSC